MLAIHVHREFTDDEYWGKLMQSPARAVMQVVKDETMKASLVFSRRWTLDGRQTDPETANAFSVLIQVDESQVEKWLTKSGMTTPAIFIQIKQQDPLDDLANRYRIIWLGKQLTDAIVATSSTANHAGIILKPPNSFGARVHVDHYDQVWVELKGNSEPIPKAIKIAFKYMISNLPVNAKAKDIEEWAIQMKWTCRVLRRFNNGHFLLGSDTAIPTRHVSMNGHPVLVSDFEDQKRTASNIVAGKLQIHDHKAQVAKHEDLDDPWSGQTISQPHKPHASTTTNPWATYKPTMQVEQQTHHTERINAIEREMKVMKDQMAAQHGDNQTKISQLDAKVTGIQHSLQQSLKDALQEQSKSLIATFQALMRTPETVPVEPPARERSRSGGRS